MRVFACVALAADGNTALIGGFRDNSGVGAAWVFTRADASWLQQGAKLIASDESGQASFGRTVAVATDGSTALIGGPGDNSGVGAAWVFTRAGVSWSQQGAKLTASDQSGMAGFGVSVALAADGNTALVGGPGDNGGVGAAWVFAFAKASQVITFGALGDKAFGDPDFAVSASASSGLTVSFAASGSCTVSSVTVHIAGVGSCTVTASQAGNASYNAAPDVARTFAIAKASQTITFEALADKTFGDPDFALSATASSVLPVAFVASGNCTVSAATVHITGAGSCTVSASQPGDSSYNAAPTVSQTVAIAGASQVISFEALVDKAFGDPDFAVSASASSSLAVALVASGSCGGERGDAASDWCRFVHGDGVASG